MAQRTIQLMEAILDSIETIDRTDGSRAALLESADEVRDILASAYGDDLEDDLAERLNEEDADDDGEEILEEEDD